MFLFVIHLDGSEQYINERIVRTITPIILDEETNLKGWKITSFNDSIIKIKSFIFVKQ